MVSFGAARTPSDAIVYDIQLRADSNTDDGVRLIERCPVHYYIGAIKIRQ